MWLNENWKLHCKYGCVLLILAVGARDSLWSHWIWGQPQIEFLASQGYVSISNKTKTKQNIAVLSHQECAPGTSSPRDCHAQASLRKNSGNGGKLWIFKDARVRSQPIMNVAISVNAKARPIYNYEKLSVLKWLDCLLSLRILALTVRRWNTLPLSLIWKRTTSPNI